MWVETHNGELVNMESGACLRLRKDGVGEKFRISIKATFSEDHTVTLGTYPDEAEAATAFNLLSTAINAHRIL
jgi:hypothetical protein